MVVERGASAPAAGRPRGSFSLRTHRPSVADGVERLDDAVVQIASDRIFSSTAASSCCLIRRPRPGVARRVRGQLLTLRDRRFRGFASVLISAGGGDTAAPIGERPRRRARLKRAPRKATPSGRGAVRAASWPPARAAGGRDPEACAACGGLPPRAARARPPQAGAARNPHAGQHQNRVGHGKRGRLCVEHRVRLQGRPVKTFDISPGAGFVARLCMKSFYITTAIDYVNGSPHLGHA